MASSEARVLLNSHPDSYSDSTIFPGSHVIALYDYSPQLPDEVELRAEDVVLIESIFDDGWSMGSVVGDETRVGTFPLVCVTCLGNDSSAQESEDQEERLKLDEHF